MGSVNINMGSINISMGSINIPLICKAPNKM